jgi:probable rRNA maturation factor
MTPTRSGRGRSRRPEISIIVEELDWREDRAVIRTIRRAAQLAASTQPAGDSARIELPAASVLLSNDKYVRGLNSAFRKKTKRTNVLAFPAVPEAAPYLGDVALAYGVVRREATAQGKSLAAHAAHLAIHGILHLLGYDHHRQNDAKVMENQEILLLARLGFANPYGPVPVRNRKFRNKLAPCPTIPAR